MITETMRGRQRWQALALLGMGALVLSSCTGARIESEREALLEAVVEAARSGDGSAFCTAVNVLQPGACDSVILSSSGIPDIEWTNFELVEDTSFSHSLSDANFKLEVLSSVVETADGDQLVFSVESFSLPSVLLPYGGQFNNSELQPDEFAYFMPSIDGASVLAAGHPSGLFEVQVQLEPWTNQVDWELVDVPNQEDIVAGFALASCERFKESVGYAFFFEGRDRETRSFSPGPFIASPDAIDTLFKEVDDQSGDRIRSRSINSPAGLTLEECALGESTRDGEKYRWSWSFGASFQGIIGIREPGPYSGSRYTGDTEERKFETVVQGNSEIDLTNITVVGMSEPYVEEDGEPTFPLTLLPRE